MEEIQSARERSSQKVDCLSYLRRDEAVLKIIGQSKFRFDERDCGALMYVSG